MSKQMNGTESQAGASNPLPFPAPAGVHLSLVQQVALQASMQTVAVAEQQVARARQQHAQIMRECGLLPDLTYRVQADGLAVPGVPPAVPLPVVQRHVQHAERAEDASPTT